MQLSIVILNYNTKGLLKQCLKGILGLNMSLSYEIIVVDNASPDASAEMMKKFFPNIKLIETGKNSGCAYGYNKGIGEASGDYIFIMNTDIIIQDNSLEKLHKYMEENQSVGMAVPKLTNPDSSVQHSCMQFPRFFYFVYRRTPLGKIPWVKKRVDKYLMVDWDHEENKEIDWAIGGAMFVRRAAIDKVGLMDERFFMYLEDTDWCRRFWQAGFRVVYLASAKMVHYHRRQSADFGMGSVITKTAQAHIASWFKYFIKYFGKKVPH